MIRTALIMLLAAVSLSCFPVQGDTRELRVCADPNNLPFSNAAGEGFENKIVELIAADLDARLSYTWWPQRRGFIRNTLGAGLCDLVSGIATGVEMLRPTRPYYRSGYVFVTKTDGREIESLDDPILRDLKIGVQLVGEDGSSPPPAHALAQRGLFDNVRGFLVYGDYRTPNPAAGIMAAVADGTIDVAIVWGPLAGYFAKPQSVPLKLTLVKPEVDGPRLPMAFDISMGVRKEDQALRNEINSALVRLKPQIDAILAHFRVPRLDLMAPQPALDRTTRTH